MHTTVLNPIQFHAEHGLGTCRSCGAPLIKRNGDVNGAHCLFELYCTNCQIVCAETPNVDDLQCLPSLLAARGKLERGNVGGMPEFLKRVRLRH